MLTPGGVEEYVEVNDEEDQTLVLNVDGATAVAVAIGLVDQAGLGLLLDSGKTFFLEMIILNLGPRV